MSDSNRGQLSYLKESTWGETPSSALTDLRFTGEDFGHGVATRESNEIRSDRQVPDAVRVGGEAAGGFDFELSYEAPPDELLEGALFGAFVGVGTGSTTTITSGATGSNLDFTLASAGNTITFGSSVTHGIVAGQWVELYGSAGDDGYHLVTAVDGQELTVESITGDEVLDEIDAATIKGSMLRNGTTMSSFTFQRQLADMTKFFAFRGQVCNALSLIVQAEEFVSGRMDFVGGTIAASDFAGSSFGTGANVAAPANTVMNAAVNVGSIREAGSAVSSDLIIQEISLNVSNNIRGNKGVGILGNADIGVGKFRVNGSFNVLFNDGAIYAKYLAGTESSMSFNVEDGDGNAYIFTFPRIKFDEDDGGKVSGSDTEVVENVGWSALRDTTYDCMMQIDKIAA